MTLDAGKRQRCCLVYVTGRFGAIRFGTRMREWRVLQICVWGRYCAATGHFYFALTQRFLSIDNITETFGPCIFARVSHTTELSRFFRSEKYGELTHDFFERLQKGGILFRCSDSDTEASFYGILYVPDEDALFEQRRIGKIRIIHPEEYEIRL